MHERVGNFIREMETLLKDVSNGKATENKRTKNPKTMVLEMKNSAHQQPGQS